MNKQINTNNCRNAISLIWKISEYISPIKTCKRYLKHVYAYLDVSLSLQGAANKKIYLQLDFILSSKQIE